MDTNETSGMRLQYLRKSNNLTLTEMSKIVKKDISTISRYEKDQLPVSSDLLASVTKHFGVSSDYILSGNIHTQLDDFIFINDTIGNRLRRLRKEKKLAVWKLSEIININKNTLASYENDLKEIPSDVLGIFSDYFKVSVEYIVTGKDKKTNAVDPSLTKKFNELYILYEKLSKEDQKEIFEFMKFKLYRSNKNNI